MNTRRSLEELKIAAIQLSEKIGKTPSRRALSTAVKQSEYSYYGMTVTDFQKYCGLTANESGLDTKISDEKMLDDLAKVCIEEKEIPHYAKLRKWNRDGKYSYHTLPVRFGGWIDAQKALCVFAKRNGYEEILFSLPGWKIDCQEWAIEDGDMDVSVKGYVYLVQHGPRQEFKIGKTNNPIRREGELKTELPEQLLPIHKIETDDPSGVENYWHRRFADKRKNGEWFSLSREDVSAFKKWKKIF